MAWSEENVSIQRISGERRGNRRYRIGLELRWSLVRRRKVLESGTGRTLDLSSGGILFDAGRQLPAGVGVEISIAWPALLHDVAPMQLVVSGRIVRAEGFHAAVHVNQHEFRTAATDQHSVVARARANSGLKLIGPAKFGTFS